MPVLVFTPEYGAAVKASTPRAAGRTDARGKVPLPASPRGRFVNARGIDTAWSAAVSLSFLQEEHQKVRPFVIISHMYNVSYVVKSLPRCVNSRRLFPPTAVRAADEPPCRPQARRAWVCGGWWGPIASAVFVGPRHSHNCFNFFEPTGHVFQFLMPLDTCTCLACFPLTCISIPHVSHFSSGRISSSLSFPS